MEGERRQQADDAVRNTLLTDITRYSIFRKEKASGNEIEIPVKPSVLTYYDTDAQAGVAYEYRIAAYDYTNKGPDSVPKDVTP